MKEQYQLIKAYFIDEAGSFTFLGKILFILTVVLITQIILKIIRMIFSKRLTKKVINTKNSIKIKTVLSIFHNFLTILIYFISTTIVLNAFGVNTTSIIAVAGVGGIAIAFAAQSLVKDIIQGAFILLEDQYNIDDLVTINDCTGTVVYMGIRLTKLVDINGALYIIPNGTINMVINHSRNNMRASVLISITDNVDFEKLRDLLNQSMDEISETVDYFSENPKVMGVEEFSDYGYKILIVGKVLNGKQWEAQRLMRQKAMMSLQKEKVSFSRIEVSYE